MTTIYNIIIGDGSEYQQPPEARPEDPAEWKAWLEDRRVDAIAGCYGEASSSVFWNDGVMYVRVNCTSTPLGEEKPQPNVALVIDIHEWAALAGAIASQRRELEGRTLFGADGDNDVVS